jgi:type IV pilus assembly protein PilN
MSQFDLNLSTRPFKPYRVANLGLFALLMILIAVTAVQLYSYQRYSALASASREEEAMKRREADNLSEKTRSLNQKMTAQSAGIKLSEVELLNQMLLKKSFSWTRLLANLESLVPEDVRLMSLRPVVDAQGKILLNMDVRGRTLTDATKFLKALENSRVFSDVVLAIEEKKGSSTSGEVEFSLSTYYAPGGGTK